jgi:hypothetical protein
VLVILRRVILLILLVGHAHLHSVVPRNETATAGEQGDPVVSVLEERGRKWKGETNKVNSTTVL